MSAYFECVTRSTRSVAEMFDLARDIDVHQESQSKSNEMAVDGVTAGVIGLGEQVTWRAKHFGIPFQLTSRVVAFDAPHRFEDEQIRGPFKSFHHIHEFEPTEGGSAMIDRVSFEGPLGPLGWVAERLVLRRYLLWLIKLRGRFLATL